MKYVGAVGPKVLYPDGVLQEAGARIHLDCTTSLIGRTDNPKKPAYNYMREVDYCSGCCLALENQQFVSLKGFDSYFEPAYYEDVDLCMRLRAKGLKTIYNPKAVIVHHLNVTSNQKENDYKLTCINNNKKKFSQRYQETINKIHEIENKNAKTHANGLNLGIIIPSLQKYGGAERFVIECVRYWQHKHNITLYATVINEALLAEHGISKQVKLVRLTGDFDSNTDHAFFLSALLVPETWRNEIGQHDIYHTHLWPSHFIDRQPMVWFPHEPLRILHDLRHELDIENLGNEAGRKAHIYPKYHYDHLAEEYLDSYLRVIDKIDKASVPAHIVANSQYMARTLTDIYNRPVSDVVYPGVDSNLFCNSPVDPNLFVTISQLWSSKRINLLIEAMTFVDNAKLIIIGSGPDHEYLTMLIQKLGLENRVSILSHLKNKELITVLSSAYAFIFSAIREPFGIVILEAMAAGKPIIAVNQGGYVEVCDDSFAFLLPPQPLLFAEKMIYLQKNPEVAKKMGEAACLKAKEYGWEKSAADLEKILLKVHHEYIFNKEKSDGKQKKTLFGIQYFLWYGQGIGASHWNSDPKYCQVTDRPLLGYYGSAKGETILYHFDLFEKMGLDYVILNLHVDQYGVNKLELAGIQHVFEIAKINKSRLKFVIQLALYVVDSVDEVIKTVDEIEKLFISHSHYLWIDNKPMLLWFWSGYLDGDAFLISLLKKSAAAFTNIASTLRLPNIDEDKSTFHFFEGFIPFSPLELAEQKNWETIWSRAYDYASIAGMRYRGVSISPGYNDLHLEDEQRMGNPYRVIDRRDGETYLRGFQFVANLAVKPDFVIISTFNEFHENSHIEPSIYYQDLYANLTKIAILNLQKQWAFKQEACAEMC